MFPSASFFPEIQWVQVYSVELLNFRAPNRSRASGIEQLTLMPQMARKNNFWTRKI
jgi:hypothetical protein